MGKGAVRLGASDTARPTVLAASIPAPALVPTRPRAEWRVRTDATTRLAVWRPDALALLSILVATAVVAWQRLWLQNGLAHLDISTFYLPWYAYMGDHLRHLDIPGWNPHMFSGTAFAGDPQSGWMYVPAMVAFTFLNPVRAYEVYLIFHLALAGVATYAYARVIGLRPVAALTAALAYEFGPLVNHISCCVIHVQLAVWIPVALLGVELTMRAATWPGRAAAWCLTGFAVSQMVAGWTGQGAYNGLLIVCGYVAYRVLFTQVAGVGGLRARLWRGIADGAGSLLLGFGLAAAGLLPRLIVTGHSNLAGGNYSGLDVDKYAAGWDPTGLLDRLLSDDNGFLSLTFYLGAPTVALVLIALYLGRARLRIPFFAAVTLFASVMSLHPTRFHHLVFALLPKFETLHSHVPSRVLAIQWIGPAMLAGIAVELLCRETDRERIRRAASVALAAWGVAIVLLVGARAGISIVTILFAIAACAVAAAFARPERIARYAGGAKPQTVLALLLALLVFLDPAGRGLAETMLTGQQSEVLSVPTGPIDRDAIEVNAATGDPGGAGGFLQGLQAQGQIFRYFGYDSALLHAGDGYPTTYREWYWLPEAQDLLVNARGTMLGLDDVQGYNPMQLSDYISAMLFANGQQQNYHDSQVLPSGLDSPILSMLNVRYIVIPNDLAAGRPRADILHLLETHKEVFRNDSVRVLENPNALPRAWTVHTAYATTDAFGLALIGNGLADPAQVVFLGSSQQVPALAAPGAGQTDSVTITDNGADHVSLDATMASAGMVVISDTYDKDWVATVDGHAAKLYRANGVVQAVQVSAGRHTIELTYRPRSLQLGLIVSWGTLGLTGAILAAYVWSRRRRVLAVSPATFAA